jgi:predicted TIM-barrel fold metal-dependent hydrolase
MATLERGSAATEPREWSGALGPPRSSVYGGPGDEVPRIITRRGFLGASSLALAGSWLPSLDGSRPSDGSPSFLPRPDFGHNAAQSPEPIIDIHQHLGYSGRSDDAFLAHQRALGVTTTILLPAGRSVTTPSTHGGTANGLQAQARGNDACHGFATTHRQAFRFGANEVPDVGGATQEIARYLKLGAVLIGEQKFGVACDSPAMQTIYELAQAHGVPVLMHWQFEMYNYGFERFHKMLEKYPRVTFLGHAQTWWANVDKNHRDQSVLYPKGPVTIGGLTDRYLSDYPNMYGDLSAGSGLNALTRDEPVTTDFLTRHQDKLIFGSDCSDSDGGGPKCQGAQTIATIRRLAASKSIERKLLYGNATRIFRL